MAKPLLLSRYPTAYFDIIIRLRDGDTLSLPFATPREAKAFRFDFYAFLRALERSVDLGFTGSADDLLLARSFTLRILGVKVTFEKKNNSAISKAIYAAIGTTPQPSPPQPSPQEPVPPPSPPPPPKIDATQAAITAAGYSSGIEAPATTATHPQPSDSPPAPDYNTFMQRKGNSDHDS